MSDVRTTAERSRVLRGLGQTLARDFRLAQSGRMHDALVLRGDAPDGRARALTSNFIEAELLDPHPENTFAAIRITKVDAAGRAYARAA